MTVSALFALIPEAEPHVAHLRERFDPAARRGLGAHITIMYPLLTSDLRDESRLRSMAKVAAGIAPFQFQLTHMARFPSTIYLAPKPASRFASMHDNFRAAFPGSEADTRQIYVPHLSVARDGPGDDYGVEPELKSLLARHGPIDCVCRQLTLMENGTGLWRAVQTLELRHGVSG